jgi:Methane/Phenol/Toluene Hydroxylase
MWLLTYRDKSPLRADDWRGFRDPDRLIYRGYVTMQDEQETVVERVLDEYGPAGHDASLPGRWVEGLAALFTPTRFPVHALQMCTAYLGQMAPASYISNCAVFGAGDLLRRVSLVAYRTRQLADATSSSIGRTERAMWERNQAWQPARRAPEELLTVYDWGECFTAMNLVIRPTLGHILLRQLANAARDAGDELTWLLLGNGPATGTQRGRARGIDDTMPTPGERPGQKFALPQRSVRPGTARWAASDQGCTASPRGGDF